MRFVWNVDHADFLVYLHRKLKMLRSHVARQYLYINDGDTFSNLINCNICDLLSTSLFLDNV